MSLRVRAKPGSGKSDRNLLDGPPTLAPANNLAGASLVGADLSGVDFSGADLRNTNFTNANIDGADFSYANLRGAVFTGATGRANFTGAQQ